MPPPPSKVCMNSINNCFGHISMDKCGEERWVRDQEPQKLLSSNWIFQPFADTYIEKTSILIYLFIRSNFPYIMYFVVGIDWNGIKLNSQQQLRPQTTRIDSPSLTDSPQCIANNMINKYTEYSTHTHSMGNCDGDQDSNVSRNGI